MRRPIRIGNSSGFYGDRPQAAREMVEGGPIDILTGDYLAELTMLILFKARQKDPTAGYATSVLSQLEHVLGTCLDRGIKIVNNAGGLNPSGLAERFAALAERLGLHPKIAYVTGDDLLPRLDELVAGGHPLRHLDSGLPLADAPGKPVTANAYLGGVGHRRRPPGGRRHRHLPPGHRRLGWWSGRPPGGTAGAGVTSTSWPAPSAAGHIIECGPQATGGNYSYLHEITDRRYPGFPIAEVAADGSSVITKHPGTGGLVSPGTVTAQLLYEIAEPAYLNPDVTAHFDTITLEQQGPDRVRVSGATGTPPPDSLKVCVNFLGGYRNTMTLVVTGLDIEEKAAWATEELFSILGGRDQFAEVDVRLLRFDHPDAPSNEQATAHLRVTVKDADPRKVGRRFSNATMELFLGGYAGFYATTPPSAESSYGVYWPALVSASEVAHAVVLPDGREVPVPPTPTGPAPAGPSPTRPAAGPGHPLPAAGPPAPAGPTARAPLGALCAARSGDKGGNANIGLWARDDAGYAWLREYLTTDELRVLLPEAAALEIRRFELPNLRALNFVVKGLLGEGVASSTRPDPQAKGLGEYLRSRSVEIPASLLGGSGS